MPTIIGLTGRAGAGKDTIADHLLSVHGGVKVAFAGPLKEACAALFCLTPHQLHDPVGKETLDPRWGRTPRQILQFVGTDLLRNQLDRDVFRKTARYRIEEAVANGAPLILVTDCRFEDEAQLVRSLGGVVWHVRRDGSGTAERQHITEQRLRVESSDVIVENNGTMEALHARILEQVGP